MLVLLVIADPARMSLGSWWLNCYVNLLTNAEMVQSHILAADYPNGELGYGGICAHFQLFFSHDVRTFAVEIVYTIGVVGACGAVENFMCWSTDWSAAVVGHRSCWSRFALVSRFFGPDSLPGVFAELDVGIATLVVSNDDLFTAPEVLCA
ncbi:hypothetical protein Nepgr_007808 [Nepenthes gracilis]|uniref:Secreted protein n=1 Tax=Nepenthes gracilis TaxID=150966 RepID=A0AAD3XIM9_NEPGR|nr:hypothetical protein Nepgr_007808 [Nepenthes gracilis]